MLRVPLTPEIIRIAQISRPQTAYELAEILSISYGRMQAAVKRYNINLPEGDLPWRKEWENKTSDNLEKLVFKGDTLEVIAGKLNVVLSSAYWQIKIQHLYDQWKRARAERTLGILEN